MGTVLSALQTMSEALDALDMGFCAFDDDDCAVLWNRTFMTLFPEHAGRVHVGEPYRDNLRRFYEARLSPEELASIDRHIDEGLQHRLEDRPYTFAHRGRMLSVVARTVRSLGRVRIWRATDGALTSAPNAMPRAPLQPQLSLELFAQVAEGLMVTGRDGAIAWMNDAFAAMYRCSPADPRAHTFDEVYRIAWSGSRADEQARFDRGRDTLTDGQRFHGAAFDLPLPDNRWSRVTQRHAADGSAYSIHVDISILKRHEEELVLTQQRMRATRDALRAKSAMLEATLDNMEQGLMMINAEGVVEVCNAQARTLIGLPEALMSTRPRFADVVAYQMEHGEFISASVELMDVIRSNESLDRSYAYERERTDGRVVEVRNVPIAGGGNLRTYTDVTERLRKDARIRHVATHDSLTELVNRETFMQRLGEALTSPTRRNGGLAVHFIDLDRFKPVNDTLGHASGDRALTEVARRLQSAAREGDVVARLGGDEFAVLQFQVLDGDQAKSLARRVQSSLVAKMNVDGQSVQIGASIGIALYPEAGTDAETLLHHADKAMYTAKNNGTGVELYQGSTP